ncbi:MAG: hypothetical protein NW208_07030 [Bryobacter sp.]|nr:hypothetical protein [Bryobacter sp.]
MLETKDDAQAQGPRLGDVLQGLFQEVEKQAAGLAVNLNTSADTIASAAKAVSTTSSANPLAVANSSNNSGANPLSVLSPLSSSRSPVSILSSIFLGPLWRGLFSLFGGGDEPQAPVLQPFIPPAPATTQLAAGASADGTAREVSTDAQGRLRNVEPAPANVSISIQALDARSLLDRSDDLASAVRQAMLSNHPINDSLTEL